MTAQGESCQPYLSVVVAARNDDHGGNPLRRMQAFVNAWIAQSKRHNLASELIVVEWNPPADRPRLVDTLWWPSDLGPCCVRFIEVPPEIHRTYRHSETLPLYQMIAKNVGIRRARGEFVLATNVDIIFSDEMVRFLADHRLEKHRMYRVDRHDTMAEVPADAPVDEQLAYCRTHLIRVLAREGVFDLTGEGWRALAQQDIASADSGLNFGAGWFPAERSSPEEVFRWVENDAEVVVEASAGLSSRLLLDLEPGPGVGGESFLLQLLDGRGTVVAEAGITGRTKLRVQLPAPRHGAESFRFHVVGGGLPVVEDPRLLNFRVFRCEWEPADSCGQADAGEVMPARSGDELDRSLVITPARGLELKAVELSVRDASGELLLKTAADRLEALEVPWCGEPGRRVNLELAVRGGAAGELKIDISCELAAAARPGPAVRPEKQDWALELVSSGRGFDRAAWRRSSQQAMEETGTAEYLHCHACGDFTLMAREHWFALRGYPEFDLFSMNLDSVLCYAAHHAGFREQLLKDPLRIYHIEHSKGSGWTPEGEQDLYARLAARGLTFLQPHDLMRWITRMRRLKAPMIFNRADWGLAGIELAETVLQAGLLIVPPAARPGARLSDARHPTPAECTPSKT